MFIDTVTHNTQDIPPYHPQHMEHWQLIAGGVAHDFNNLLTSILGQSTLALRQLPEEAMARGHIEKVIKAAEYAAALSDQLLTYSKGNRVRRETINFNRLIQDNINLLNANFLDGISLQLALAPGLPSVRAKRGQLQQVVMNLLINAAEAIQPNSGTITIQTGVQSFDAGTSSQLWNGRFLLSGEYVTLQVKDDGVGMDAAIQSQVFQPFFTTKPAGRGLGLSAIHDIVLAHNGAITVNSQIGEGTVFTVYLPCATAQFPPPPLQ